MENKIIKIALSVLMLVFYTSCVDDDFDIGAITAPTIIDVTSEVVGVTEEMPNGDGSGSVKFKVTAENAMTYKFIYNDGFTEVSHDGTVTHSFNKNGVNEYLVTVIAYGAGGTSANRTTTVTVFSDFSDPEAEELLTGGNAKTWYVAAAEPGHLALSPSSTSEAGWDVPGQWYAAAPFEKAGSEASSCFYTDEMVFSLNENGELIYNYNNNGATFVNVDYTTQFGGDGSEDTCLPFDSTADMTVSLSPASSGFPGSRGTTINIANGGTISYYIGTSSYEILSIDENTMHLRAIMGKNPALAWFLKLTTTPPNQGPSEFESQFSQLIFEQEFEAGALNTGVWNYEIGNGENGWGNQEAQYYTQDNVTVEDGNLVITAKAESTNGFDYSSGRITTQDNFEFTYGRVDVRAKLPAGGGVWPAIWMLGSDFDDAGWPEAGEIDVMEYKGNVPNEVHSTLHYPGNFGGDGVTETTAVENAETEFHVYSVEWTEENIVFLVDNVAYHTFENTADTPFHKDFFLILNVAMGGTFGGSIDPAFAESSMVVDYVRVFQ
jgi:hypothetical protein